MYHQQWQKGVPRDGVPVGDLYNPWENVNETKACAVLHKKMGHVGLL